MDQQVWINRYWQDRHGVPDRHESAHAPCRLWIINGLRPIFQLSDPQNMTKNSGIAIIEHHQAIW